MPYPVGPAAVPFVMMSREKHHEEAADYHEERAAGATNEEQVAYHDEAANYHRGKVEKSNRYAKLLRLCKAKYGNEAGISFFINLHTLLKKSQVIEKDKNTEYLVDLILEEQEDERY